MPRSLNRITIIGRLGSDPELRSTPGGTSICKLSVATSENYKDKTSGEWKEDTEWHKVVLWSNLAESAAKNLKKGKMVAIEGKNKTRTYDKDGQTHYITEIIASNLVLLEGKTDQGDDSSYQSSSQGSSQKFDDGNAYTHDVDISDNDDLPF